MANLINSNKYLDLTGLGVYDGLIKGVITAGDQANATALAENDAADKKHHSIRFGRVTDDAITVVGYGTTGSITDTYLNVLWSTANHRFVAYDSISGLYYSEWSGPNIPSSSDYTLVSSSSPEEQSTPHYDKVYIDNAGGVYAYSPSESSLVTVDVDLGVLKTGGVTYNSGTNQFGYGGTSGGGNVNKINLNSGIITGLTGIYSIFDAPITISGNVIGIKNMTLNSGTISGASTISGQNGRIIFNSGTLTISGQNGRINFNSGTLTGVGSISFVDGNTLTTGNGAVATGTGAIWAKNFGVSGDLLFSGSSTVQKRFGSGALPVITFTREFNTGSREYTDVMSLGKGKTLSTVDYYNENSPLQPSSTPEVRVSGTLNVSGTIYAGNSYNTISGNSGGMNIRTTSGHSVAINGVNVNSSGSISEVATLEFKSGGTLTPSIVGVQEIFGKNNVHISMSGSTTGDGIDFGNAPLKRVNGIAMSSGGSTITDANLSGSNNLSISGYGDITMASLGTLNMGNGTITGVSQFKGQSNDVVIYMTGNGKFSMFSGVLETSGVILKSGGTLTFGDGTTMSTAATPTNLDDADNVIGGKELKIYYGTGGASMSPFSYNNYKTQLSIGRVSTDEVSCSGIICSTISGTLRGTIQSTTFSSGNTFTTGFIDELKTALGIS